MKAAAVLQTWLPSIWQRRGFLAVLLLPLAALFAGASAIRRLLYRHGILASGRVSVPVIVVGNITVGGSGKTPLVIWLVERMRARGYNPGVISRGYRRSSVQVTEVRGDSRPPEVGDEPLLIARRSGCPVFVGADRLAAARALLAAHPTCDVIVSDDGLQHYRLAREVEIVLFDSRGVGNGWPLPAGPLREPLARAGLADIVIANGRLPDRLSEQLSDRPAVAGLFSMALRGAGFIGVGNSESASADDLRGRRVHALAGIGNPQRFFAQLRALGLDFEPHAFPDHHAYSARELGFAGAEAILMTEKDGVKCESFADRVAADLWALRVDAQLDPDPLPLIEQLLERHHGSASARHPGLPGNQGAARL